MEKMKMETKNWTSENIEKIGELFPNVITEARGEDGQLKKAINFEALRQVLSEDLLEGDEAFEFTWVGKKAAMVEAGKPIRKTLRPSREESKNWDTTENLYIEGDNLDVLKLLQESYLGKVKMIYIDPPYNTGNDFIYNDHFEMDKEDYEEQTGLFDNDLNKNFKENNESNPRFHSDWCSMIYPRLQLARNLLAEDGVIFISIDDVEQDDLIKICSQVFGENNVEHLVWNKEAEKSSGTLKATMRFRRIHEHIIVAYKSKDAVTFKKINEPLIGREQEFQTANLAVNSINEKKDHKNYFSIQNPSGDTFTRQWKWGKEEIERLINENLIYWGSDGKKQPRLIIPTDDRRTAYILSILLYGGTTMGRLDFESLMGGKIEFSYPKPVILLKKLLDTTTETSSIILDFFSGSATTAHAVMQLNAEDGGKRKFIMVQLPEETAPDSEAFKAGYKNICEIGKERIRRAGEKIKAEIENNSAQLKLGEEPKPVPDIGFRVLKLDDSNMKDVYYTPAEYSQTILEGLESNIKEDRTDLDLLFGCLLEWGLPLSMPYTSEQIDGFAVHTYNEGDLIACFDENISEKTIKEIAKRQPLRVVFRDSSFASSPEKINVEEIFKLLAPNTSVRVL